jgi:hypothetical protein
MADEIKDDDELEGETVQLEDENLEVEDTPDGGAVIRIGNDEQAKRAAAHFANLVEDVDQSRLKTVANDLLEKIERDKESRKKRDEIYEEGLRRTGLGDDAPGGAQFTGANKVVHPMLVEACVDFSARVMKELFPPTGPVKSKIIGVVDKEKASKAERKVNFMNWQTTEQMPEFRGELEQLSTQLPLGGAQYLKLMWNAQFKRPTAEFIPIDDIYLPFAATNFYSAERKTHVQYLTKAEYQRRVKCQMYRDVDLPSPEEPEFSRASKANDKIEGREASSYNEDGLRTVFEVYTCLDIENEGEYNPYIISIDKSTNDVLGLYRNWDEDDDQYKELEWIVEFPFVPWRGAYPIGLTHMIGSLSGGATGALRALLDSAHIQNMPTLLKLKGGPDGQTLNLQPTEVAEIDGGSLVDDIRKMVMAVPFNGPSPVLFQLLGFLVDAGKGVIQTSFEKLSDQNPNMPVGTTVALIEQGMVVFSSIHSRLHNSMGRVFKILHRIDSAYLVEEDIKAQIGDEIEIKPEDFDGPMDIIPVSDPAIFSETQRFAQTQAVMQRAAMMPQMYDQRKVEEMFLRSMKISDEILQPKPGQDNVDPVSENVAAAMGRPIYVLPNQDHIAHLKAHMAFLQSPLFGMNPVIAQTYLIPMVNHLRDHLLNYYLTETHHGVELAEQQGIIGDEAQDQVKIIARVQQMIEQELSGMAQILPAIAEEAKKYAPPPMPQDNSMAVAQLGAQVQTQAIQQREASDARRAQLEAAKLQMSERDKQIEIQRDQRKSQEEMAKEAMRQEAENHRLAEDLRVRYQMNTDDNEVALKIAAAEIATGDRVAVSTGTGINPNP